MHMVSNNLGVSRYSDFQILTRFLPLIFLFRQAITDTLLAHLTLLPLEPLDFPYAHLTPILTVVLFVIDIVI